MPLIGTKKGDKNPLRAVFGSVKMALLYQLFDEYAPLWVYFCIIKQTKSLQINKLQLFTLY